MNPNPTWRFVRQALYMLKRQYGAQATILKLIDSQTDYRTGRKRLLQEHHTVQHAIILPASYRRRLEQGVAFVSANKSFMSQAGFDHGKNTIVIDAADLPAGFVFGLDDHLLIGGRYYKILVIDRFECGSGWVLQADHVAGADFSGNLVHSGDAAQQLTITQEAGP